MVTRALLPHGEPRRIQGRHTNIGKKRTVKQHTERINTNAYANGDRVPTNFSALETRYTVFATIQTTRERIEPKIKCFFGRSPRELKREKGISSLREPVNSCFSWYIVYEFYDSLRYSNL